jgi:hypothetical protein
MQKNPIILNIANIGKVVFNEVWIWVLYLCNENLKGLWRDYG